MGQQVREPTWPFLCLLACLFVLSAAAPQAWKKTIRTHDIVPTSPEVVSEAGIETVERDSLTDATDGEVETFPAVDLRAEVPPTISLNDPMPPVRPTVENVRGLLMVVPSPRIARRSIESFHLALEPSDAALGGAVPPQNGLESSEAHPCLSATADLFLSEELNSQGAAPAMDTQAAEDLECSEAAADFPPRASEVRVEETEPLESEEGLSGTAETEPELPVVEVEAAEAETELPVVEPEAAEAETELPVMEVQSAETETELPVIESEAADAEAELPVVEPESAEKETELPVAEVEAAEAEMELPVVDSEVAEVETETPVVEREAAESETELPVMETSGSGSANETVSDWADDRDMSAVAGISILSPEGVAALAAECEARQDRLADNTDWRVPVSIIEYLKPLSWECDTGAWAREVILAVTRASADLAANSPSSQQSMEGLLAFRRDGVALAQELEGTEEREEMRSALKVLSRRVHTLERIAEAVRGEQNQPEPIDWAKFKESIRQVQTVTTDAQNGAGWASFLELDTLAQIADRGAEGLTEEDRDVARCVLLKLQVEEVSEEQIAFLESPEIVDLENALKALTTRPIEAAEWVSWLEAFERTNSTAVAERLAVERLKLSVSSLPAHVELARHIEETYCSPNVRIAVTGYLLNRMLPDREPEYQWVRDTVLGHPVRGRSLTSADVGLALIPDSKRMRAALTVDGLVSAWTSSTAGPATFVNDSKSEYSAVKKLELTPKGILFQPAEVSVDNETRLRRIRTDFDGIPLLSSLVQSMARSQHEANRPAIRREMNRKVQKQAERQIDEEIDARFGELNDRLQHRLLEPLASMSLRPEVAEAQTTAVRMSMQLRLAGPAQLGSNTPRPWAPSDSVLSFQIHQSALNNVLSGLKLDGVTMTIKELREHIARSFNRPELLGETTEHDDVSITFAPRDAARIDFQDGRIAISLGISRLRAGGRQWRDFRVCAYYRPEASQQSASLVRDGVVELIGRLRIGSQITLRGIFGKTFAKGRELPIVPQEIAADPRLEGLEVTQVEVDNGWFALAVGPERIQPAMANSTENAAIK